MTNPKIAIYCLSLTKHILEHGKEREESLAKIKSSSKIDSYTFIDQDQSLSKECAEALGGSARIIDIRDYENSHLKLYQNKRGNLGYKGMCAFNSCEFFKFFRDYDYIIRLDGDCKIFSGFDLDEHIKQNLSYGYASTRIDLHRTTCETLPPAISNWVVKKRIPILCNKDEISAKNYYNNFHISKGSIWKENNILEFLNFIKKSNGIMKYRWGDSTIQANAVRMFLKKEEIVKIGMKYSHGSHNWKNY